ncbi:hypothetical protein ASPBRDRAFT_405501 [Aspergillus brasiliensis CBS 101740]|uniref:Uncharacterized protein n=1 Tax=Aspergillus brasiliensis (strain CBS 101740 / IMI 381727 / IBT 21946) TaxID=767769 RepID=A0A1L9UXR4_ASPBC|nr:hypothetical protein ASPBRDRAFT_405501 [Aspergillus brasiliensis CBS 101740]
MLSPSASPLVDSTPTLKHTLSGPVFSHTDTETTYFPHSSQKVVASGEWHQYHKTIMTRGAPASLIHFPRYQSYNKYNHLSCLWQNRTQIPHRVQPISPSRSMVPPFSCYIIINDAFLSFSLIEIHVPFPNFRVRICPDEVIIETVFRSWLEFPKREVS